LEKAGLAEDTIVFFWSDHGVGMPRCKRWMYDSGTHIPLIVHIPEKWRAAGQAAEGAVEDRLVSSVDFGATVLNLTGLPIPGYMHGRPFLGGNLPLPREYVYGARDRMDERYDTIRMIRDKRFKYIRNYQPHKPYDQFMNSAEKSTIKQEMHRLAAEGALPEGARWITRESKPIEELYDTGADPHEMNNLAEDPELAADLERMRKAHESWMRNSNDLGLIPEPELVVLEKRFGSRYHILRQMEVEYPGFAAELRDAAVKAGRPKPGDADTLLVAAGNEHATIRYWGVMGIGNLPVIEDRVRDALLRAMADASPTVRVAAARACAHELEVEEAIGLLRKEITSPHEWVRLHAAIALDELGEKARPAIPELKQALDDRHNKYVVRVANHALNVMLGTDNKVR
jgi:uncharacterized sulfatase